ncbi:MAG: hypothetical protein GVY20_05575 [Bacteroidetes bacterium]|jgi:hypothetical protein|nr:hypothetical protein [Bacteroidota bacterium]
MFLMAAMCEDECDQCQSSINHMYEKIDAQGCNPNTMQKAWDQIREDCDHFDSAVGLMAETCTFGNTAKPGCNLPAANLSDHNIHILLDHGVPTSGEVYNIVVNVRDHTSVYEIKYEEFAPEETRFSPDDLVVNEGDIFEIIIEYIDQNGIAQEIAKESQTFTFARNGLWDDERVVFINLHPTVPGINFFFWENA